MWEKCNLTKMEKNIQHLLYNHKRFTEQGVSCLKVLQLYPFYIFVITKPHSYNSITLVLLTWLSYNSSSHPKKHLYSVISLHWNGLLLLSEQAIYNFVNLKTIIRSKGISFYSFHPHMLTFWNFFFKGTWTTNWLFLLVGWFDHVSNHVFFFCNCK